MKDQLKQYVELLFAGAPDSDDVRQEILQNTLDRYDDLIDQGKTPQAAYTLAIAGIGDVSELLECEKPVPAVQESVKVKVPIWKQILRALAICLYILCPAPLFVLSEMGMDTIGLCGLLAIVAVATALMVISGGKNAPQHQAITNAQPTQSHGRLRRMLRTMIWGTGFTVYFVLSFLTQAWHITWLIFPMIIVGIGLANAIVDLKEG